MRVENVIPHLRVSRLNRDPLRLIAFLVCIACAAAALAGPPSAPSQVVPPAEQIARDSDRIEVLRQELKKSEVVLEDLARRKADRLQASDPVGVKESEEQHIRTMSDIVALKRELAVASRSMAALSAEQVPGTSAKAVTPPRASSPKPAATAPWWDVYGKARHAEPATPVSLAPAPSTGAHPVTVRRLE